MILLKNNYNFASHVYSEVISELYRESFDNNGNFTTAICDKNDKIQMKLIKKIERKTLFSRLDYYWNICYNILNGSYIKPIELNQEQNYITYKDRFIKYNPKNDVFINGKEDIHLQLINKIDVTMTFNKLYDIIEYKNIKYIFSIELTHLCYSKIKPNTKCLYNDSDNIYKKVDVLIYCFYQSSNDIYRNLIFKLVNKDSKEFDMDITDNYTYIHGIYRCNLCKYNDEYNKHIQYVDDIKMNLYRDSTLLNGIKNGILKNKMNDTIVEAIVNFFYKYDIVNEENMNKIIKDFAMFTEEGVTPKKRDYNSKVQISFDDFMDVVFLYDKDGNFCSNELIYMKSAYKSYNNNNRYKYILSQQYNYQYQTHPLKDSELIELFTPKPKKIKQKPKQILETNPIIESKPIIEPTNVLDVFHLTIEYVYGIEVSKIIDKHLHYIVNYIDRFTQLYEKYKSILVIKSYDKYYTNTKYFNFRFGKDKNCSKCFHVYLTNDLTGIMNITYIESIKLN